MPCRTRLPTGRGCIRRPGAAGVARGAQPEQGVDPQQIGDHGDGVRADLFGLGAAPGRGPHRERDLLRRVVGHVGLLASGLGWVGGDQLTGGEDLHHRERGAGVDLPPDEAPRHRIQTPLCAASRRRPSHRRSAANVGTTRLVRRCPIGLGSTAVRHSERAPSLPTTADRRCQPDGTGGTVRDCRAHRAAKARRQVDLDASGSA